MEETGEKEGGGSGGGRGIGRRSGGGGGRGGEGGAGRAKEEKEEVEERKVDAAIGLIHKSSTEREVGLDEQSNRWRVVCGVVEQSGHRLEISLLSLWR